MKFEQLIAKYVTGNLSLSQLPQVAYVGIQQGLESESLEILAGLESNENSFIIERYFNLTIEELGLKLPDKRRAALEYAVGVAEEIIEEKKDLIVGVSEIYSKAICSYDFYSETEKYVYDSIIFEKVYGLFNEYDDLQNEHIIITNDRTKLIAETRVLLLNELIAWKEKMQNDLTNI